MVAGAGAAGAAGERAEGVILVVHRDRAAGGEVFADVAVAIIGGEVVGVAAADPAGGEQAADAARALHGAAEIKPPGEGVSQGGSGVLGGAVPAIIVVAGLDGAVIAARDEAGEMVVG